MIHDDLNQLWSSSCHHLIYYHHSPSCLHFQMKMCAKQFFSSFLSPCGRLPNSKSRKVTCKNVYINVRQNYDIIRILCFNLKLFGWYICSPPKYLLSDESFIRLRSNVYALCFCLIIYYVNRLWFFVHLLHNL